MYKAIIEEIKDDGFQILVRIPYFDKLESSLGSNKNLYSATVCTLPGCKPCFSIGEIVFITFENNDNSKPVIVGTLHRKNPGMSSVDVSCQSLNVEVDATFSNETLNEIAKKIEIPQIQPELDFWQSGVY